MRLTFFFIVSFFIVNSSFAQVHEDDPACREKCGHAPFFSREQQLAYYQYSSMDKYDVKYLKLDIAVEPGSRNISGNALTRVLAIQPLDSFVTELKNNMIVDSVFINGIKLPFLRGSDHLFIPFPITLPAGTEVNVLVYYRGTANTGAVYAGTVASNGLVYAASLSESYQAREWFPVKQQLSDKIDSADIWITTSDIYKAGSNGKLVEVESLPDSKSRFKWKSRYPMNYYMPSFSVGNYMEYINYAKPALMAPDSIPILNYIVNNASYFTTNKTNIDKTPPFLEKFSELFGMYPFKDEKYGHAHASIGGGMEHQTMSTMNSFGSTLIAHELGHQWWGDAVTCASWNHIWLNEGFASYSEYLAIEKLPALFTTTNATSFMQSVHNNVLSSATGSVYVPEASVYDENRIFSGRLSYNKGSAIIHTLRFEMQDDNVFFQTLKNFQQQYNGSVATAGDFKLVAENTSGKNFTDYFNQWYYGEGYPTFNVTYIKQGSDSIILIINETVSAPSITPFFKGLFEFRITSETGDTTVKLNLTANNQQFKFRYTRTPTGIVVDPNNWVLNNTGSITNGGVIPVNLISFEGKDAGNCTIRLTWKTANEQHVREYTAEYSNDGVTFSKTGSLASLHTSTENTYQLSGEVNAGAIHFFRLRITDTDGTFTYSDVIKVNIKCKNEFTVQVTPNPVTDKLNLIIMQPEKGNTSIRIYNPDGRLMYETIKLLNEGENKVQVELNYKFLPGAYLLRLSNVLGTKSRKFIKL